MLWVILISFILNSFILNMSFVGFQIEITEALRLLKLDESFVKTYYDTQPIQNYLKNKKSKLVFQYIDKGSCLLGYPIARGLDEPGTSYKVNDTIIEILRAQVQFHNEIKALDIDISKVFITLIEEEPFLDTSGEPYVINL